MTEKQYNDQIKYILDEIKKLKNEIENGESEEIIIDSYEIDKDCYDFINIKDEDYFKIFFDLLKMYFKEEKYKLDNVILKLEYDKKNIKYKSFIKFVKNNFDILQIKKLNKIKNKCEVDSDNESDNEVYNEDCNEDDNIEEEIEIMDTNVKEFKLRNNQIIARNNNKKNNYCSGIHNQVTGAGKSIIMMLTINDHYNLYKNFNLYIITCPRIEVLNKMFFEKTDEEEFIISKNNINFWKKNNIIDLDKFNIIDKVNYKCIEKLKLSKTKPSILIVNSDYLKKMDENKYIDYNKLNFVIFDECHGVSANKFYDLLYKIKYDYQKHIIGFSATPVRDKAEDKVKKIFSKSLNKNDKGGLNIISNYDIMTAICDGVVLPPSYTIVEIKKTCNKKIGKSNKDITEKVIKDKLKDLPYKKIICWCGSISKMKEWYMFYNKRFPELKLYCSTSKDVQHKKEGLDTDYDEFCEIENNAVLLTVHRCREGSDIKNLDMGVYLDHVKKRGILVCIQTVGRILRPDINRLKKCGYIIDTFVNDGKIEIEVMTAQRIISYYEKVLGLTTEDDFYNDLLDKYKKMKEIFNDSKYDENSKKIKIKIDGNTEHDTEIKLELITKNFDWSKFTQKINSIIDKQFGINEEDKFNIVIDKLKKIKEFNQECDFWKVYEIIDKKKYDLPENLYEDYKTFFDEKTWFEIMGFDTSNYYKTIQECKIAIGKINNYTNINENIYNKLRIKDNKLPPFPKEYFKKNGFTTYDNEFLDYTLDSTMELL